MPILSVKVPDVGEGIAEAELVEWLIKIGDEIREDQVVATIMTDKATVEIPSPISGIVAAIGAPAGSKVAIGSELLKISMDAAADLLVGATEGLQHSPVTSVQDRAELPPTCETAQAVNVREDREAVAMDLKERPAASPSVRRRAKAIGLDLKKIEGTGPRGRIVHADIDHAISLASKPAPSDITEIKVVGLRRLIARKMAESKRRVAHFSYVEEIDVTELETLRNSLNDASLSSHPRLTLIPFVVAAIVKALPEFPNFNGTYDDEAEVFRRHRSVHMGVATQTDTGLMVPVIRNAECLDLWSCAREIKRLADTARSGQASRDELVGSTFTITSLGALGGIVTTPVVNHPEVAIVGINRQRIAPVWRDGSFVPRTMMNLSSSFDHRIVDGYEAARFIQSVRRYLEQPALLFLKDMSR